MKEKEYLNYIPPNCTLLKTIEKLVGKRKRTYLIIVCKTHGEFKIRTDDLKHRGCKGCCRDSVKFEYDEKWKEDCTLIHSGKYNYNNTIVRNVLTHSEIFCNSCNSIFKQTPASHKSGQGCMICARVSAGEKLRNTMEHVITKAKELGFNYNFTNSVYKTCKDDIEIVCDKGHTFYQSPDELLNAEHGCQKCAYGKHSSKGEQEVYNI